MKIINKIKAFFIHQEEPVELDLIAAEIKAGKAFLHPRGEENVTYLVRSDDIEMTLSKGRSLSPRDIFKTEPKPKAPPNKEKQKDPEQPTEKNIEGNRKSSPPMETTQTTAEEFDRFKKKKIRGISVPG